MSENPKKRKLKHSEVAEKDSRPPKVKKSSGKIVKNDGNTKKFSVKQFRKRLQEDDFISDFHQFLEIVTENPEIIAKYLEVGGQPLEIVTTLGKIDKSSLDHITCILSVLQRILIEILSNSSQYTTIAINGCRFLLNKYRGFVESLLESHATNHRKIALKVLTACVTLDSRMGFDVLKLFRSHLHGTSLVERFAKHRKEEISHPESSLRTAFTHFVLSYLVEGNNLLIQNILDKLELLVAVLTNLHFDTPENIVLVLGTLRNFVLKKVSVSKTLKFRLFSPEIVRSLLELYNWKGPKAFLALANNQSVESVLPEAKDVEIVSGAVHDFLILLLTSNKYGIIVQSLGNQKKKKNIVPSVVLKSLQMPWNNSQHESLVIHMLKACPELVDGFLRNRARFLEDIKFLSFLDKLITSLTPKIIQKVTGQIGMGEMSNLIKNICLNPEILDKITEKLLKNANFEVRLNITSLLTTMLLQCNSFLVHLSEVVGYQELEMKVIRGDLLEHVVGKFPKMDTITNSLYKSIDENLPPEDVLRHLEATVDLLAIATETIPTFIDKTTSLINFMQLMEALEAQDGNHSRIELKIIKLILLLDPQVVSPDTGLFSKILTSFLNIYSLGSGEEVQEVEILLRNILYSTRLFDSGPLEIDIWLEAFKTIDRRDINVVQEFFIKLIKKIKAKPEDFAMVSGSSIPQVSEENLGKILERIERNEATVGIIDVPGLNTLLPAATSLLVKKPSVVVVKYIEEVAFNLFHYLVYPGILPEVLEKLSLGVSEYMKEAIGGKSLSVPCEFSHPESHKLLQNLMQKMSFEESLTAEVCNGKAFNLIYLIIFCHTRLHHLSQLDSESSSLCSKYVLSLLRGIHSRQVKDSQRRRTIVLDEAMKVKIDRKDPLCEILKYIFCSQINILNNFSADLEAKTRPTVDFILKIYKEIKEWDLDLNLQELTVNFRKKLIQNFRENLPSDENFSSLLKTFDLDQENCLDLLKIITEKNVFHDVLIVALERITEMRGNPLPGDVIKDICGIFVSVSTKGTSETAINSLSDTLTDHLSHFHSSIGDVPEDLLQTICVGGKNTKPMTKLASLLLERSPSLIPTFCQTLEENYTKKELMYPLLSIVLARKPIPIDNNLLDRIFREYKNGIMKSIEKPLKAGVIYRENYASSLYLIEECMSGKDCVEFTKKTLKPDSVEIFQCLLIEKIYQKARSTSQASINVNFYKNFLNLFTILLKKPTLHIDKLMEISRILTKWPGDVPENSTDFSSITESQIWTNFSRSCLKIGLQQEQMDDTKYLLIYLLATLLDRMYQDDCGDEFLKELYEMTFSHSNFLRIFLQNTSTKTATAYLLLVLARKNSSGFDKGHIPLLLGAYGAKMSRCDQYILALLNLYEMNNIDFSEYRPFLWGDSAVSHYSLEDNEETGVKGILEEPSMDMVISLISLETMKNTLSNFPIWRHLNPLTDLPALEMTQKSSSTEIERAIDGEISKNPKFSGILTKRQDTWNEVYDPAFFVPLLSAMFAPEVFTSAISVAQNGLLGMVFEALSSQDEEMRLAAGLALMRYKRQMEGRKDFLDRNVWLQFYTGTQNGLGALGKVTGSTCPRLPHVSANFVAKVSSLLTTPLAQLYKPISDYVLSRESFDFSVVPNFNFMFLSADVDHQNHREFLLGVISDGIKCEEDFYVLELSGALETIMVFFSCPFASIETNLRILSVINTIVRIPNCSRTLVDKFGLIPWLAGIIGNLETFYYDTIDAVVHIIVNLWCSVEYLGDRGEGAKICHMAVKMVKFLSARMPMVLLAKFIRVLNRTSKERYHLLTSSDLDHLIECAKPMIAEEITSIRYVRENGAEYAGERWKKDLLKDNSEDRMGLINLGEYVINWTASDRA